MLLWEFRSEKRKVVTFVWVQGTKGRGVFSWNGVLGDSVLGVYYTMRLGPGVRRVLSVSVLAVLASRSYFLFFFFFALQVVLEGRQWMYYYSVPAVSEVCWGARVYVLLIPAWETGLVLRRGEMDFDVAPLVCV